MFMLRQWKQQQQQQQPPMVYELIKPFHLSFGWIICRLFQFYHAWFFVSVSEHDIKRNNGKTRRTIWNMNRIQIIYEWDIFIYDLPEILIVARELKTRLRNEIGDRCLSKCGKESKNNFSSPPTKNISLNANYTNRIYIARRGFRSNSFVEECVFTSGRHSC